MVSFSKEFVGLLCQVRVKFQPKSNVWVTSCVVVFAVHWCHELFMKNSKFILVMNFHQKYMNSSWMCMNVKWHSSWKKQFMNNKFMNFFVHEQFMNKAT
jgi:hypothetical protein